MLSFNLQEKILRKNVAAPETHPCLERRRALCPDSALKIYPAPMCVPCRLPVNIQCHSFMVTIHFLYHEVCNAKRTEITAYDIHICKEKCINQLQCCECCYLFEAWHFRPQCMALATPNEYATSVRYWSLRQTKLCFTNEQYNNRHF